MDYHETRNKTVNAYTLPLSQALVGGFIKFMSKYQELRRPLRKREIPMTNSQYTNFHNLRHYGIIRQIDGELWEPTPTGQGFFSGKVKLLTPAGFMDGETLPEDHPAWATHYQQRRWKGINDFLPEGFKQRPEYQEEARTKR